MLNVQSSSNQVESSELGVAAEGKTSRTVVPMVQPSGTQLDRAPGTSAADKFMTSPYIHPGWPWGPTVAATAFGQQGSGLDSK